MDTLQYFPLFRDMSAIEFNNYKMFNRQIRHSSLGLLVSWSLGLLVSWSLGLMVSWSLGLLVSRSLLVSWSLGLLVSVCVKICISVLFFWFSLITVFAVRRGGTLKHSMWAYM